MKEWACIHLAGRRRFSVLDVAQTERRAVDKGELVGLPPSQEGLHLHSDLAKLRVFVPRERRNEGRVFRRESGKFRLRCNCVFEAYRRIALGPILCSMAWGDIRVLTSRVSNNLDRG